MPSPDLLMTVNAGSSTVKIGLFELTEDSPRQVSKCLIDFRVQPPKFHIERGSETLDIDMLAAVTDDLRAVIDETFDLMSQHFSMDALRAVGHRVVHGGERFTGPVRLDGATIRVIADFTPLAPLHQPQALRLIDAIDHLRPHLLQTASFDTAFHSTQPDLVRRFALPRDLHAQGIKRYGFHGLSYRHIAAELARRMPAMAQGKIIVAHLGSGASLCALDGGKSCDCSMGFSTLDGIPMATRPGNLDPGVLLHLMARIGRSAAEIEDMLYHRSGLLGVSGFSADTRELLRDSRPEAREALDLFTLRIAGEAGRMCATLGGLDALVFTAGIGEHQPEIRAAVAARLQWLGLEIDEAANFANAFSIGAGSSRVAVFVIPANEEQVIAEEAMAILDEIAPA